MIHPHPSHIESTISLLFVAISYILFFVAYFVMIYQGYKRRTYMAPLLSIDAMLAISLCCVIGPFLQPELFYPKDKIGTLLIWIAMILVWAVIFLQYLAYARRQAPMSDLFKRYFYAISIGSLIVSTISSWLFIVFIRDYYVNVSWPIATLGMALGYVLMSELRTEVRHLSVAVAWLLTFATLFLYVAAPLAGMDTMYPCHSPECFAEGTVDTDASSVCRICFQASRYDFMYWIYIVGVALFAGYAINLARRRKVLAAAQS